MDRCVNCNIATGRCNTLRRRTLDNETTLSVFRQWLAPQPVTSSDRVCQVCWDLAQQSSVDGPRQLGHRNVCPPCGRSLASQVSHLLNTDSTRELRIYNVVQDWIRLRTVEVASRICHTCWVAADRAAIHMSGPSSSSKGSFNKSDISGNTNQLGLVKTAVPKLQIQPPLMEPQLEAPNTKLSVSDIKVQDQKNILVTQVYRYFEQEYEELKNLYGDLDLTPLSKFRQRTALATGVSETTLQQILKEEEEQNADKRREPPQTRRAARKRRRQSDSSSKMDSSDDDIEQSRRADDEEPENSEIILPVEMKSEPSDGEISMNEEPEIFIPPVKVEPSDGDPDKEQTDPISLDVKTEPRHDEIDSFAECDGLVTEPASTSAVLRPPSAFRRSSRPPRDKDIGDSFYGSDLSSDESDDENSIALVIPRALQSTMETPMDDEDEEDVDAAAVGPARADNVPSTATVKPWNFEWKDFPKSPIPPESRRETFSQSNVGPTTPRVDPYDIFVDIWDRPIMEHIASETNKYAQQVAAKMLVNNSLQPTSRIKRWFETTVDELYVYFGIILAMGVVVKSRLDEYWAATPDIFYTPGFSAHMSIDRFLMLSKCLHFNDNDGMCELDLDAKEARLFKIKPILSHLNKKFQTMYTPAQNISLDESLLMWKGWLEIGQLIPNKAAIKGIKTYELCESQTGYLWRFEIHTHKKTLCPPQQFEDPLEAPSIVLRLIQGLEHKGYTLWMDNFYNSPCLARRLKSLGFDCVGTLRTDRKFVPQALHNLTKQSMRKGQIAGLTSGDVDVMVWRDINRVAMISTYHGNGQHTLHGSTKPILISDYNIMMGGVDKKDQRLAMYPVERKRTRVWYKKLFRRLLNVSVLNSFVIHRHSSSSSLSHRNFRMSLIRTLLSKHRPLAIVPVITENCRFDLSHRIEEFEVDVHLSTARRPRRTCAVCKRRVQTFCVGCSKTLCIKDCFVKFHK